MVSLSSLWSLGSFVIPFLLPKIIALYRSIKNTPKTQLRPVPPTVQRTINILFVLIVIHLLRSIPTFQPENIFTATSSRLYHPTASLFKNRVSLLRPNNTLTDYDNILRRKLGGDDVQIRQSRPIYAAYGPAVLTDCLFCAGKDAASYAYYAIPALVLPHLLHGAIWGLFTSSMFSGEEGRRFRTQMTLVNAAVAGLEFYYFYTYDPYAAPGMRFQMPGATARDTRWFYWEWLTYRSLLFAMVDIGGAALLYLTSTNRLLSEPPSIGQQLQQANGLLNTSIAQINTLGPIRNAVLRDEQLKGQFDAYWDAEPRLLESVEQEREVVDARNIALSRMDPQATELRARNWVDAVFGALNNAQRAQVQQ